MIEPFTRRQETRLVELIKLGTMEALKEFKKDARAEFMSKSEFLSMQQGRHSAKSIHGNNGDLKKEKLKFWGAMTGLVFATTTVLTTIGGILLFIYIK